jgi:murein L,D-transpeptidase YcbB/YkuD
MSRESDISLLQLHLSAYLKNDGEVEMFTHYYQTDGSIHAALDRFADLSSLTQQMTVLDEIRKQIQARLN